MSPQEIRNALAAAGITQADVSRICKVTSPVVCRVIDGTAVSNPVQVAIAAAIEKPVEEVFPKRYPDQVARKRRLDAMARATEQVRMAS